jgi:CBS-domain-containing membrane protein
MLATGKRLLDLTAADLMSRDVFAIQTPMSVRVAAHQLAAAGVSGAPVVDEHERCVGVLSATDLMRFLDQGPLASRRSFQMSAACLCSDWEVLELETLPVDDVSRYMTTDIVTASPETGIGELARTMLDAHIHRVIVVDAPGRPVGIVSSTDVLAAVAAEDLQRPCEAG